MPATLRRRFSLLCLAALLGPAAGLRAQVQVTGVTYSSLVNNANTTVGKLTYNNNTAAVNAVETTLGSYVFSDAPGASVAFRRGSSGGNNATVFYQYSGTYSNTSDTVYSKGDSTPTLNEVMLSNDLTQGLRNPFANRNGGSTDGTTSNIERIDFTLPNFTVTDVDDGFVFFDLENYGNSGDGFRIAAFTATGNVTVNGTVHANAPTVYANTGFLVPPDSFGNNVGTPTGTDATYLRSSTTYGDNLYNTSGATSQSLASIDTSSTGSITSADLILVGVLVRFSDLGLNVGDVIQGYSLIASDTVVGNASDLVNWGNSSVYLTNTDATASAGNMDFMGFGAQVARNVPEPSTYGLIFVGGASLLAGWRRRRTVAKPARIA